MHHRKLRSQLGKDELSNLLAIHHHCHNGSTTSVHLSPAPAYERGQLVRSWDDPAITPLILPGERKVLLGESYTDYQGADDESSSS